MSTTATSASDPGEYAVTVSGAEAENYAITYEAGKITVIKSDIVILDENSTTVPTAASNVDVHVKRTIKANEWSTICLPFSMTEEQVKSAFGDDVILAEFLGYETEKNSTGNIYAIKVKFDQTLKSIEANHPCLIKVGNNISEFDVENINIIPEENPVVAAVQRTSSQWSELVGTYVANTVLSKHTLFISENLFWYSDPNGRSKMKAFRAYFDFSDVLTVVEDARSKITFFFDDTTAIKIIEEKNNRHEDTIYTLNGVRINGNANSLKKGIYIINGKKVLK